MSLTCRIDTTNLNFAQQIFNDYGSTVPALSVNRTALFVVRAAQKMTPVTSISRIDTELSVEVTPVIGKRGRPLKNKKGYKATGLGSGGAPYANVPLTWLIISARAKAGSAYNLSTSNRWMIGQGVHPFKGRQVSEFASIMAEIESRMVKSRHSSTHFFQSSWTGIINNLLPVVPASYRSGLGRPSGPAIPGMGEVKPARPGPGLAVCRIDNLMGMAGIGSALDEKRNQAAHRIMEPLLQRAIDAEFDGKMAEAARRGWLDRAAKLTGFGFRVS